MNSDHAAQVLVIGAGPAGCAAAMTLARAGIDTILVDQSRFPRDKVCGDALIPDALRALDRLGLARELLSAARPLQHMRVFSPNGSHVELDGQLASLPRLRLDNALRGAAVAAGARFLAPLRLARFMESDGTLCGACFKAPGNRAETAIRAELLLLATGAASAAAGTRRHMRT
ncbi:FAD-dependent monooxygenase [Polaromonas sp. P1-6]|nr:FAD-dependent monooxygenase [Polaromonas sp. P1-6]UUZ66743.1 FAD-dependent monooxygenase [Polaromonas sp. P2-4]